MTQCVVCRDCNSLEQIESTVCHTHYQAVVDRLHVIETEYAKLAQAVMIAQRDLTEKEVEILVDNCWILYD